MITINDLKAAIAECQGERTPTASTCIKLAAYYICLREIQGPAYSNDPAPVAHYSSDTEFGKALQSKDLSAVLPVVDELMTTLSAIQPRLYDGVMRRLKDI